MRSAILSLPLLALAAACAPTVVRDRPPPQPVVIVPPAPLPPPDTLPPRPDIAAETRDVLDLPPPQVPEFDLGPVGPEGPLSRDNGAISSEQEFGAVAEARSIEEDAARLEAARERFEVVPPTALERPDDGGANVVAYALGPARPVGTVDAFPRGLLALEGRAARACDGFVNADAAQEAFLAAGGPQRDRRGLDPDGDGNACGWDPATYSSLVDDAPATADPLDATGIGVGGSAPLVLDDAAPLGAAAPEG